MTREHLPCGRCARFAPAKAGTGHCTGFDRPAQASDQSCVLFVAQGSLEARMAAKSGPALLAEFRQRESRKH